MRLTITIDCPSDKASDIRQLANEAVSDALKGDTSPSGTHLFGSGWYRVQIEKEAP